VESLLLGGSGLPVFAWLQDVALNELTNEQLVQVVQLPVAAELRLLRDGCRNGKEKNMVVGAVRRRCELTLGLLGEPAVVSDGSAEQSCLAQAYWLGVDNLVGELAADAEQSAAVQLAARRAERLLRRLCRKQQQAKELLLRRTEGLLFRVVGQFVRQFPEEKTDLLAVARQQVLESIARFDVRRGTKFSTLVYNMIRWGCFRHTLQSRLQVHMKRNVRDKLLQGLLAWQRGTLDLADLSEQDSQELLLFQSLWAGDAIVPLSGSLEETLQQDDSRSNIDCWLEEEASRQLVRELLRGLPRQQQRVAELRLQGGRMLTDIAEQLYAEQLTSRRLSKERVRQILNQAMSRMQLDMRRHLNG